MWQLRKKKDMNSFCVKLSIAATFAVLCCVWCL